VIRTQRVKLRDEQRERGEERRDDKRRRTDLSRVESNRGRRDISVREGEPTAAAAVAAVTVTATSSENTKERPGTGGSVGRACLCVRAVRTERTLEKG